MSPEKLSIASKMKHWKGLLIIFSSSIGLISYLYVVSKNELVEGNFQRVLLSNSTISLVAEISLLPEEIIDDLYFNDEFLWLNNRSGFSVFNTDGKRVNSFNLEVKNINPIVNYGIIEDTLYYYVANSSTIKKVKLISKVKKEENSLKEVKFNIPIVNIIPINNKEFFILEIDGKTGKNFFNVGSHLGESKRLVKLDSLQKEYSVATSGKFFHNKYYTAYVPFYQDNIFIIGKDISSLRVLKTIDQLNQVIEVNKNGDRISLGKDVIPHRIGAGFYQDRYLLLSSFVKSKNQNKSEFIENNIIDIYNLKTLKYVASITIPKQAGESLQDFSMSDTGILAGITKNKVLFYDFSKFIDIYLKQ